MFVRAVLLAAALPALCVGYASYIELIPNGDRVPNPAVKNAIWKGVGHDNQEGGGKRNPFGRDFAANGDKWDACLCHTDSDGDGRTNGQELGDPDCEWTPGKTPKSNVGLSHPGICEPINSDLCKEKNTAGHERGMERSAGGGGSLCPVGNSPISATRRLLEALRTLLQ